MKKTRSHIILFITSGLLCLFSACGFSENLDEANAFMKVYFDDRIEHGTAGPNSYYAAAFLDNTTPEKWDQIKRLVNSANGPLKSYELNTWNINKKTSTNELSGTFVQYVYKTIYEKGEGMEQITLLKNNDTPDFKIVYHNYSSSMIQDLMNKGMEQAIDSVNASE